MNPGGRAGSGYFDVAADFAYPEPALREAMQRPCIRFHREIHLWRARLGFNPTHSIGLVMFGAAFLYVGVFEPAALVASRPLQGVVVSATYFAVARSFFFSVPTASTGFALACFLASAAM